MTDDCPHLGDEITNHKSNLNGWVSGVSALKVSASRQGVCDRFVRDCQTLIADLDNAEDPSSADLCDFADRTDSLEIQYHQITDLSQ